MANQSFSAVIEGWTKRVAEAEEAVFKESVQALVKELDAQITSMDYDAPPAPTYPKRTGFLRASLVASREAMPQLVRDNPGVDVSADYGDVILTIAGSENSGTRSTSATPRNMAISSMLERAAGRPSRG